MSDDKIIVPLISPRAAEHDELQQVREENARLKALLTNHGIAWEKAPVPVLAPSAEAIEPASSQLIHRR